MAPQTIVAIDAALWEEWERQCGARRRPPLETLHWLIRMRLSAWETEAAAQRLRDMRLPGILTQKEDA